MIWTFRKGALVGDPVANLKHALPFPPDLTVPCTPGGYCGTSLMTGPLTAGAAAGAGVSTF
jgi:hypothetical protein